MSDGQRDGDDGRERTDGGRDRVAVPDEIELPRLLDFYDLQTPDRTGIHEFYANLREGELTTTTCRDCEAVHFPPRVVCPECLSEALTYTPLPDRGTLFAFSEMRAGAPIGMEDDVPFVVAVVEVGEVRLSTRIDDARIDDLEIGDPVELKVVEVDGPADHERVWFRFVPADG